VSARERGSSTPTPTKHAAEERQPQDKAPDLALASGIADAISAAVFK
jgi:hypothetical protein